MAFSGCSPIVGQPAPEAGIDSVLVANRGEIAVRVLETCRRLGLRTIAIFTPTDARAGHLSFADQAIQVPSYLDISAVVEAAVASGASAIHPGYGFLSERAEFAEAVAAAGLMFVGPAPSVLDLMGRKDAARNIAVAAGVPVVPGYAAPADPDEITYPVLVKAAAGGGGKGMRVVRRAADLPAAMASARRESAAAFGDDTLLIETFVERGRHIEVQILADGHGQVRHLFERDCSVQRRHQKVLEEAPAPNLSPDTRTRLLAAAVALAEAVDYTGAGTVEFLLDPASERFYFLEMNTRLQVEHRVTELVLRTTAAPSPAGGLAPVAGAAPALDLVEWQLRIAAGEKLPWCQAELATSGHAIEARIYAEDPYRGFLPQAGRVELAHWPSGTGILVDQALSGGDEVSTAYDPMLAKIVAFGADREAALRRLHAALTETAILGINTNTGFLAALVATSDFAAAGIDNSWLDRNPPAPESIAGEPTAAARAIAAWWLAQQLKLTEAGGPFAPDCWRLTGPPAAFWIPLDELCRVDQAGVVVADRRWAVKDLPDPARVRAYRNGAVVEVCHLGQRFVFEPPAEGSLSQPVAADGVVRAPMPCLVTAIDVGLGNRVEAGQRLGALEAMKMEVTLSAPVSGYVTAVRAKPGSRLRQGAEIFRIEPQPASP